MTGNKKNMKSKYIPVGNYFNTKPWQSWQRIRLNLGYFIFASMCPGSLHIH